MSTKFIYAARDNIGRIKIGTSWNPEMRCHALSRKTKRSVDLIGYIEGTITQEFELHRLLSPWRCLDEHEWYWPNGKPVAYFVDCMEAR